MIPFLLVGAALGGVLFWVYLWLQKHQQVRDAKSYAEDIIAEAKDRAQELLDDIKREAVEREEEAVAEVEAFVEPVKARIESLKEDYEQKKSLKDSELNDEESKLKFHEKRMNDISSRVGSKDKRFRETLTHLEAKQQTYVDALVTKFNFNKEEFYSKLKNDTLEHFKGEMSKYVSAREEEVYTHLEKNAKRIVGSALHRFQRPYVAERGINNINFPSEENMNRTMGPDHAFVPLLEQLIGVDLTLVPDRKFLNVSAFDPVRRELTRITVEKMMRDKRLDEKRVNQLLQQSKKQLFKKIRSDGNALAKELNLRGLHPEIKNRMGSLRYRYSFSQNQYFHCSEVGWLCGLLSSELGVDQFEGRRAGMLHDLGKSMDHSIDGGHAVIGADFIDKHGEKEHIVHAVRAHHYDETPNSDLAYLVIASDAISGARPGARRSTAENYLQKMNDLERIGNSFPGVNQTFILSAGREVRVMVNAQKFDDLEALQLSKKLATKIEEEMTYPGQIRVTVVRETQAIQYAK